MDNLLYIIATVLIIGWAIGFFGFHSGNIIHVLLIMALVAVFIRFIQGKEIL